MIGIGVVGCGYWGPNLVRVFSGLPGANVVAVSDQRTPRLAAVSSRYPGVKTTTDYRDLVKDASIDAIVVATPVSTHFEIALDALKAGKHVLVEKPLAASSEQVMRLIDEASRRNLKLMVDHTFVYTGAVRKIKEMIESERLGKLYYYDSVRVNLGLFQHDVNVMWDLAVHDLAILDYVIGREPSAVVATGISHVPGQPEDIAYLTCFFEDNLIAHFHVNWLAPVKVRRTLIGGDRQMIVYDELEADEKIKIYDSGITIDDGKTDEVYSLMVNYRAGDMWAPRLERTEPLLVEATHFIDCIVNDRVPLTDGEAGLRVVRILEASCRSLKSFGAKVNLNGQQAAFELA